VKAMERKSKKGRVRMLRIVLAGSSLVVLLLSFVLFSKGERTVGRRIAPEAITEFYYTEASSSYPPTYRRCRFYREGEGYFFYHETREGNTWPLREEQITDSGRLELREEDWTRFLDSLNGGKVMKRGENAESGGNRPDLYLYWEGDRGKYQEFAFKSWQEMQAFEALCAELEGRRGE